MKNNHGKVGKSLYFKFSPDEFYKNFGDKHEDGYIISLDEINKKYWGITGIPIHIDASTQVIYEVVCEDGVEVYG